MVKWLILVAFIINKSDRSRSKQIC